MKPPFATLLLCAALSTRASWVELADGTRLGGELHWRTNGIVVTATNGAEQTVEFIRVRRAVFIEPKPTNAASIVTVTTEHGVPLSQCATDSLNGIVGYFTRPGQKKSDDKEKKNRKPGLTDAKSPTAPNEDNGWFTGEVTWDLGDSVPAPKRQLERVDIWIRAHDAARCDYSGALAVSVDGEDFITLEDTVFEKQFGEPKHGGEGKVFNRVSYQFAPGAVTDFRYLRFIAEVPQWTRNDSRFVEVDGFVSRGPARPRGGVAGRARVLSRRGSELCGTVTALDENWVTLRFNGADRKLPVAQIARVVLRRIEPSRQSLLVPGRTGVLLRGGDFFESEIEKIAGGVVTVSSVLFGLKRFDLEAAVAAIQFTKTWSSEAPWEVRLTDGSRLLVHSWQPAVNGTVELDEVTLGKILVPAEQLQELSKTTAPARPTEHPAP